MFNGEPSLLGTIFQRHINSCWLVSLDSTWMAPVSAVQSGLLLLVLNKFQSKTSLDVSVFNFTAFLG